MRVVITHVAQVARHRKDKVVARTVGRPPAHLLLKDANEVVVLEWRKGGGGRRGRLYRGYRDYSF